MRGQSRSLSILVLAAATLFAAAAAYGQTTTGTLSGTVTDQDGTAALPGAAVAAVHEPTGTRYSAVTRNDGRFSIPNVRVGGPYQVTVTMDGFQPQQAGGVNVGLGQDQSLTFRLSLETVSEELLVVAESSPLINPSKTGAASQVATEMIETLPSIGRGLEDFARTNPFFTVSSVNQGPDFVSIAGRNGRYNSISIDGAVNNDLFGLAETGTPGGQAGTTPISLDAIQELQLVLAPFDVRQGGFSGGGINAVTRSGGNAFDGSVFYYLRDEDMVGDGPAILGDFGEFKEEQYGFRIGGPIWRDKVFFFANAEVEEGTQPTGFSIDGSGGQAFADGILVDEANLFRQTLIDRYGFDPGGLGQVSRDNPSDKYFGRIDWNVSDAHSLTLRHNYVDAAADVNRPGREIYEFPSEVYDFQTETNSTVLQVNSAFGSLFNEFRVTNQTIKDRRAGKNGVRFPWIEIEDVDPSLAGVFQFQAGTEQFSTANALDQDIIELHDDITWLKGAHTITIGTHNEFFEFDNLFIQNAFGAYEFTNLADFVANRPARRYQFSFANPGQPLSAKFEVQQYGLYFGDLWAVKDNLTLNFGLRVDAPFFPDAPERNPLTETTFGFRTDEIPDGELLWQPRLGFNWDLSGNGSAQLRGGAGIFAGRTPYVWIANQYTNNGLAQTAITASNVLFNPDPDNQPSNIGSASRQDVNLIDPDFKFPTVLRYNLAYDHKLPWWNLVASAEAIYGDSRKEIDYANLNLRQTGTLAFDGRPRFGTVSSTFGGAFLIRNTDDGSSTNVAIKLERPYSNGIWGYVSYAWGESEAVNDGTSSRAVSNWQFNEAFDPNNAVAGTSDFEVEHRFNTSLSYRFNHASSYPTTVSLFYNLQSGRPYSSIFAADFSIPGGVNGDGFFSNDLFFVPADADDVRIIGGGTWEQLDAYIRADKGLDAHRGETVPINSSVSPWSHSLDLHLAQQIPIAGSDLELTFDLLNLGNLIDEDSGTLRFVNFSTVTVAELERIDPDGVPVISLRPVVTNPDLKYTTHNIRSRWQAKLGVRWSF